jgi:hypothetical protein
VDSQEGCSSNNVNTIISHANDHTPFGSQRKRQYARFL